MIPEAAPEDPRPPGITSRRRRRWVAAALVMFVTASLVGGVAVVRWASSPATARVAATPSVSVLRGTTVDATSVGSPTDLPTVIARAMRSVVSVRTVSAASDPFGRTMQVEGQGSGVIIGPSLVVTNAHVVDGAQEITVRFGSGGGRENAVVLGTDATHDLAVLSVPTGDHPAIAVRTSAELALGDQVIALGYPLGLGATATTGIVSGLDRTIDVSGSTPGSVEHLEGLLQTDAAINPGNSGGPLLDATGRLIGINTAAASASAAENIGFAIAIDEALPVVRTLEGTAS